MSHTDGYFDCQRHIKLLVRTNDLVVHCNFFSNFDKVKKRLCQIGMRWLIWFFEGLSKVQNFINNQFNFSYSPDRADILWALRRRSRPQIKARAGKGLIKMPEPVAAYLFYCNNLIFFVLIVYESRSVVCETIAAKPEYNPQDL
jgi:hypothetical protein